MSARVAVLFASGVLREFAMSDKGAVSALEIFAKGGTRIRYGTEALPSIVLNCSQIEAMWIATDKAGNPAAPAKAPSPLCDQVIA